MIQILDFVWNYINYEIYGQNPRSIIWAHENNGFDTVGPNSDHQHSHKFDYQGLI